MAISSGDFIDMNNPIAHIKPKPMKVIEDALEDLERLCTLKLAAAETFSKACAAVSEKSWKESHIKLDSSVIRSYVTARVRNRIEEYNERAEQMNLLMDDVD